ncbi:Multidrug resistance-associated protein 1 [Coemansia spiralis]|uniref:Multidrug resistance-associated protein 1 n=1 Tax=Coemansia spiralis TaxID=417178 RepID=A0A9W8G651_9FUNG|nr:Multidrug resistance-associated protein 1 [Coemansia spiralis]
MAGVANEISVFPMHIVRCLSIIASLSDTQTPVATALGFIAHLLIAWNTLDTNTKACVAKHVHGILQLNAMDNIVKWERGNRDIKDFQNDDSKEIYSGMSQNFYLDSSKAYFVTRAVLRAIFPRIAVLALLQILLEVVEHYRAFLFIQLLGHFVMPNDNNSNANNQNMLSNKLIELYIEKNCESSCLQAVNHAAITSGVFFYRNSLNQLVQYAIALVSQVFNVYVVVSRVGWLTLIPILFSATLTGASQKIMSQTIAHRRKALARRQPDFTVSITDMIAKMRAIKFHNWERVFEHNKDFETKVNPPFYLQLQDGLFSTLSETSARISVAATLAILVFRGQGISYAELLLITSSMLALVGFTKTIMIIPSEIKNLEDVESAYKRVIDSHKVKYFPRYTHQGLDNDIAVVMDGCKFHWGPDKFSISSITMQIKRGEFITVVGKVGSGKSSLLLAIGGEMPIVSGSGSVHGSIGYVSQKPWIMNATFRENVIFGNEYDEKYYRCVIDACALVDDLAQLPSGDLTEIGHRGINLSGGQNARLALARAIYNRADIYILDDILSAVDAHVERHLIEHVLAGNGILANSTRILVTHAEHVLPLGNKVVTMTQGQAQIKDQKPIDFIKVSNKLSDSVSTENNANTNTQSNAGVFTTSPETEMSQPFSWQILWRFIKLSGYAAVALSVFIEFANTYMLYHMQNLHWNLVLTNSTFMDVDALKTYIVLDITKVVLETAADKSKRWIRMRVWDGGLSAKMQKKLVHHWLYMRLTAFERLSKHTLDSVFFRERSVIAYSVPMILSFKIDTAFKAIAGILGIIQKSATVLAAGLVVVVMLRRYDMRRYAAQEYLTSNTGSIVSRDRSNMAGEVIAGHQIIRMHNKVSVFKKKLTELSIKGSEMHRICMDMVMFRLCIQRITSDLLEAAIILYCKFLQVYFNQPFSPGKVQVIVGLGLYAVNSLNNISIFSQDIMLVLSPLARYFVYSETLEQELQHTIMNSRPPANWPNHGLVEFKNYSMRYRDDLDYVLKDLSFAVRGNEKIGIVGRTGAGKSSLSQALLRIVEPTSGKIVIDGINTATIGLADLRSRISIVPQDPVLFEGTVRENLDPLHEHTDDEIWNAIRKVQIKDIVMQPTDKFNKSDLSMMKNSGPWIAGIGLHKWVENDGVNFSVGQRQLLSLCRALLWHRKILILDEATANIDSKTDQIMQSVIRNEFKDCTVLIIAHRLKTVLDSDRILVMDQGQVAEFDTPSNLLAQGGLFAKLVESMEFNERTI